MIINANALHLPIASNSVQCIVTSPPYYGLRDYGVDGQIGLEQTPAEYVENIVAVFRECWRVLRDDGVVWLNLGDSYAGGNQTGRNDGGRPEKDKGWVTYDIKRTSVKRDDGLKPKDLIGIPWRVAFALQAAGWWLRQDIIWHKPNPMPESVTDRCTKAHEYVFLLTKSARYFYDAEAIQEAAQDRPTDSWEKRKAAGAGSGSLEDGHNSSLAKGAGFSHTVGNGTTRNRRSVWSISTKPFSGAHFACMPPELAETCIRAGTSKVGCCPNCGRPWVKNKTVVSHCSKRKAAHAPFNCPTKTSSTGWKPPTITHNGWKPGCDCADNTPVPCRVFDPFAGSGTTGMVAVKLGREFIGTELNYKYIRDVVPLRMKGIQVEML